MHVAIERIIFGSQLLSSPPTRDFILSSQVFVFQTGKMSHRAFHKDPHHTHTRGPASTLNLPPSNLFTRECGMTDEELALFFQAHAPTRNMKVIRIRKIRRKGRDWRREMKGEEQRKGKTILGLVLYMRDKAPDDQSNGPILSPTFGALYSGWAHNHMASHHPLWPQNPTHIYKAHSHTQFCPL